MSKRLENKIAIIIGGSKGIGAGIVKVFAQNGATVIAAARHETLLEKTAKDVFEETGCHIKIYPTDITKKQDVDNLMTFALSQFGRVDILCQNAGIFPDVSLFDMTGKDWDLVLDTNLKGTFYAVSSCIPIMRKQRKGRIVITSSITGVRVGNPGLAHYGASKAGINGFVKTAAIELAPYGITINCVEPGNIITEGLKELGDDYMAAQKRAVPMGFLGDPEDIGHAVAYLASDEARYVTGQSIVADGGQTLPESHYDIPKIHDVQKS